METIRQLETLLKFARVYIDKGNSSDPSELYAITIHPINKPIADREQYRGRTLSEAVDNAYNGKSKFSYTKIRPVCQDCGSTEGATYEEDPYVADVKGDYTPVWLCATCRASCAADI